MKDVPQLQDAAIDLYEACVDMVERGHKGTCDKILDQTGPPELWDLSGSEERCTCGIREVKKAIAYARGDDPLQVDSEEGYEV